MAGVATLDTFDPPDPTIGEEDRVITAMPARSMRTCATPAVGPYTDGVARRRLPAATPSLDIDPFDEMLLAAGGAVTTMLEACTGEPIESHPVRHAGPDTVDRLVARSGTWWRPDPRKLDLAREERVIVSRVSLCGAHSRVAYVLAESVVVPDRMPHAVAERMRHAQVSLERLLAAGQLESRRDPVKLAAVRAGADGDHLAVRPSATLARRTYTVMAGNRPVAAVTEWLPPGRLAARALRRSTARTMSRAHDVTDATFPTRMSRNGEGLSRRELEVTDLVADGLSNAEIAERLYISKRTVESHLEHVKYKLRVRSRPQIIAWVLRARFEPCVL
jgi:DNA-binding NarL/FixJ family response regulator